MKPDVSIVIEWENVILADMGRSLNMLERLRKQICELGRVVEVIVLFDPDRIDRTSLENKLVEMLRTGADGASFTLRVEEARGKHYYDLKNEGARRGESEIVLFLDSDVIPDEGWLENILKPLYDDERVKVVGGNAYVDYNGIYSKAFAAAWFWNLRVRKDHKLLKSDLFHANNVAFRKEIITAYPFPEMPEGVRRKSCVMLSRQLEREGITIWINTAAQVSHPAPNGVHHFFIRALAQGRDSLLAEHHSFPGFLKDFYLKKMVSTPLKIVSYRKEIDLPLWQTPAAIGIMLVYYTTALTGAVITAVMPRYAKSSWKI